MTETIVITEPRPLSFSRESLEHASGLPLELFQAAISQLVSVERSLDGDRVTLNPGTMIGAVRIHDLKIEVRSRLNLTDLVTLIRYAYDGDYANARTDADPDRDGLDELLGRILADELDMIRQRGVSRLYVRRKEALTALRGRPDFLASFPWNDRGMTTLTCQFHELSCDTLDNQIVLATLEGAVQMDVNPETRACLIAHRHAWYELTKMRSVSASDFEKARSGYSRLTQHYRLVHRLGEMIISRLRPRSMYDATTIVTSGVVLDMAELFELAVRRMLQEALGPFGIDVKYQSSDRDAIQDDEGQVYRRVRPDIIISRNGIPIGVVDAKYKDYWEADSSKGTPVRRISNEDLYQLYFYSSRLQAAHHLPEPPAAIIVSPLPGSNELNGRRIIADRYRSVTYRAGGMVVPLKLVFLPLGDFIASLSLSEDRAAELVGSLASDCQFMAYS